MALTLAQIRQAVFDYLSVASSTDSDSVALRSINMAIDFVNSHRFNKSLIGVQEVTLSASTQEYALPTGFKDPRSAELLSSSGGAPQGRVPYIPWRSAIEENGYYSGSVFSPLDWYTVLYDTSKIRLAASPSAAFVSSYTHLKLRFHKRITALSGESDTLGQSSELDAFVVWKARAEFAAVRAEREEHVRAEQMADRLWSAIRRNDVDIFTDWQ